MLASLSLVTGIVLQATLLAPERSMGSIPSSSAIPSAAFGTSSEAAASANSAPSPRLERGVPVGFARTAEGAVAAASSFVCTGQTILDMDPLSAEEAVRQMAAARTADKQVADTLAKLRIARAALASGTGATLYRQAAIAWRMETFSPDRARVAIWSVGVLARDGVAPPQAGWATSTFDLVWEREDWRIESEVVVPGPAPLLDASAPPATATQLIASLEGFTDFGSDR